MDIKWYAFLLDSGNEANKCRVINHAVAISRSLRRVEPAL